MFPKIGVPQIIHSNRVFHYKPCILGYPYFWKHPHGLHCTLYTVRFVPHLAHPKSGLLEFFGFGHLADVTLQDVPVCWTLSENSRHSAHAEAFSSTCQSSKLHSFADSSYRILFCRIYRGTRSPFHTPKLSAHQEPRHCYLASTSQRVAWQKS